MNKKIKTRRFLKTVVIGLSNNGIHIIKKSPFESIETDILFEQIEPRKLIETKANFGLLTVSLFLLITGVLFLFGNTPEAFILFFFSASLILIVALVTKLRVITIYTYRELNIELFFSTKNKAEIAAFADGIIDAANNFLIAKFSKIDKDLPVEGQLENLTFLRNKELISEEKFEQLKNQLLGRENKKSIGYR
jgi:hypothetical protein